MIQATNNPLENKHIDFFHRLTSAAMQNFHQYLHSEFCTLLDPSPGPLP